MPNDDIKALMPILEKIASQCETILEIGPAQGNGSTVAFAKGIEKSAYPESFKSFITVDIRDYMDWKPSHLPYWKMVLGDSTNRETVEAVKKECKKFDLIFIDTHHTYEQMKRELELWPSLADNTTVFLFHDTYMNNEYNPMTDAIKEFAQGSNCYYEDITKESHGLGMMYLDWRPIL